MDLKIEGNKEIFHVVITGKSFSIFVKIVSNGKTVNL
jgi:hypothetical protein